MPLYASTFRDSQRLFPVISIVVFSTQLNVSDATKRPVSADMTLQEQSGLKAAFSSSSWRLIWKSAERS